MKRIVVLIICLTFTSIAFAEISRVRVINNTKQTVYIHKGGYASSVKISAGKWKIFYFPFKVIPPGSTKETTTSLLVATAGGRWTTTPDGYTSLNKPEMILCLDYRSKDQRSKNGNRMWDIKRIGGFDKGCKIKGYKQPWYQESNMTNH